MRRALVLILLAGLMAGCNATTRVPAPPAAPAGPDASAGGPAPVQDARANLPDRFEVATADPAWSARVEGSARVLLDQPDGKQRTLRVEMHEAVFDGRYVQARDASGMVEIRITPRLCLDRASTQYPYTARLTIEGEGSVLGCGRPLP
jgi:uncharacterized membrane protein